MARSDTFGKAVILDKHLAAYVGGQDPFSVFMELSGDVVRDAPQRRTLRVAMNGHDYYAKLHMGVGWKEVLKNVLRLRRPVLSAHDEWRAIHAVQKLGIRTTPPVAFGEQGTNPARRRSFLITRDLGDTVSLEDLSLQYADTLDGNLKRRLINEVARIARTLHTNGINHRDFYLCHFRMNRDQFIRNDTHVATSLVLMDLHRAQLRSAVPQRWIVKDLGGLLFSALDAPLTLRDILRFARHYHNAPLRDALRENARLWRRVWRRALRLHHVHYHRPPKAPVVVQRRVA